MSEVRNALSKALADGLYLIKAGVAGGQLAIGGSAATDELIFKGSSDSNRGAIVLSSSLSWDSTYWNTTPPSTTIPFLFSASLGTTGAGVYTVMQVSPGAEVDSGVFFWLTLEANGQYKQSATKIFTSFVLFQANPLLWTDNASYPPIGALSLNHIPIFENNGAGAALPAVDQNIGVNFGPILSALGFQDLMKCDLQIGLRIHPHWNTAAFTTINMGTVVGVRLEDPTQAPFRASAGSEILEHYYGLQCTAMTFPTTGQTVVVESDLAAASDNYFLRNQGGAQSVNCGIFYQRVDSTPIYVGASDNAFLSYDGSNFICDPDFSGSGRVYIGATGDDDMLLNAIEIDGDLNHDGSSVGFYGTVPVVQPTVTGSRGGNVAVSSLLTELASLGLIIDSTTA